MQGSGQQRATRTCFQLLSSGSILHGCKLGCREIPLSKKLFFSLLKKKCQKLSDLPPKSFHRNTPVGKDFIFIAPFPTKTTFFRKSWKTLPKLAKYCKLSNYKKILKFFQIGFLHYFRQNVFAKASKPMKKTFFRRSVWENFECTFLLFCFASNRAQKLFLILLLLVQKETRTDKNSKKKIIFHSVCSNKNSVLKNEESKKQKQ